jgi:hypothetical protein
LPRYTATTADNFKAAARPSIKAIIENRAMMKPFWYPLITANKIRMAKTTSIIKGLDENFA